MDGQSAPWQHEKTQNNIQKTPWQYSILQGVGCLPCDLGLDSKMQLTAPHPGGVLHAHH